MVLTTIPQGVAGMMKLRIAAFAISLTTVVTVVFLILTIWTRLSSTFGSEFMDAFHSIHPHPYGADDPDLSLLEHVLGSLFDMFYAAMDAVLFSLMFGSLYNLIIDWQDKRAAGKE